MVHRAHFKVLVLGLCLLLSSLLTVPASRAGTVLVVKDKLGRTVKVKVPVKRAIVIVGYELIPALKVWKQVIGVSSWAYKVCDLFKRFYELGKEYRKSTVGTGINLNIEKIFKLKPDLIITWTYDLRPVKFLSEYGFPVYTVYPDSIKELFSLFLTEGKFFGKLSRARFLVRETKELLNFIKNRTRFISDKKKILYVGVKPTVVSGGIGIPNELIKLIGGINPASNIKRRNAEVSIETIYKWNPDVIFIWGCARYSPDYFYSRPEWSYVSAVKHHRVYKLPNWSTWSPRIALIALYMAKKAYPKLFKDVNFKEVANQFYEKVFGISFTNTSVDND